MERFAAFEAKRIEMRQQLEESKQRKQHRPAKAPPSPSYPERLSTLSASNIISGKSNGHTRITGLTSYIGKPLRSSGGSKTTTVGTGNDKENRKRYQRTLVSTQGETGELTRRVLSSERVVRLFANLLNVGRLGRKQEILLDTKNVLMRKNAFANQEGDWSRQIIVHELVHYAYRSPASSMTNALSVLHTIFRQHENSIPALWVVLQQCTKLWCGEELNGDNVAESIHTRSGALAELVKVVVLTLPRTIVRDIVQFMNQRLFSCVV
ncbi:hypothetical protein PsorP6_007558 [Peronosclerospora sorghi]|uniref:Uncharacterized protein n=1 Tax=Peronosclerospora sorghi TaxID=230839 RepID=A0ACC0WAJ5_9STRA|nr:hypothetical protein PsorP6_007558 [Peronosclerospora sorghi]